MFDTLKIGKTIKQARIDQNMTQMNLADAMGVSYQAVSNWERGNSMPDISKLAELCGVLHITVEELLGMDAAPAAKAVVEEPMTMEALMEAAPALPPAVVKERVRAEKKRRKLDLDALIAVAPFLDEDTLNELMEDVVVDDLDDLAGIAPFVSRETLKKAVEQCGVDDLEDLVPLAVFLGEEALGELVEDVTVDDLEDLVPLAPFLPSETLEKLVADAIDADTDLLEDVACLAPFLGQGALARILKKIL